VFRNTISFIWVPYTLFVCAVVLRGLLSSNFTIYGFPVSATNTVHKCIGVEIDNSKLSLSATGIVKRVNWMSLVHSVSTARHRLHKIDSNGLP